MKSNSIHLALVALLAALSSLPTSEARSTYGTLLTPHRRDPSSRRSRRHALDLMIPRDPFDLVSDVFSMPFYSDMNRLLHQHDAAVSRLMQTPASPRYAVTQDLETGLVELSMELPGVTSKDVSVELENNKMLHISGSRVYKSQGSLVQSDFHQSFQLDDNVDADQLKVTLSAGILKVTVPKMEKTVKKLEIVSGDETEEIEVGRKSSGARITATETSNMEKPQEEHQTVLETDRDTKLETPNRAAANTSAEQDDIMIIEE